MKLEAAAFYAHLGARLQEMESLAAALNAAQTNDLYLACACLRGDRAALDAFERVTADVVGQSLAKFDFSDAEKQDIAQSLRVLFFIKRSLDGYSGRGALRGWVRSAATRAALDAKDARKLRPDDEDEILGRLPATGDLELDLIKQKFNAEFKAAFGATIASLAPDDRTILAQHYVDDLSIDQLAAVLGVHRATVARRVAKLRETLLTSTKERLQALLKVDAETLASLMRVASSRLHVSVFRDAEETRPVISAHYKVSRKIPGSSRDIGRDPPPPI